MPLTDEDLAPIRKEVASETLADLASRIWTAGLRETEDTVVAATWHTDWEEMLTRQDQLAAEVIVGALNEAQGNKSEAARILGVSRHTLWKWIRRLGL